MSDLLARVGEPANDLKASTNMTTKSGNSWSQGTRCLDKHPPLKIGEYVIYGGSCSSPRCKDADVYIGFDSSMQSTAKGFPWTAGHEIYFRVPDQSVPTDVANYHKLVEWTAAQLIDGRKVHVGCIGGHGRTGMFLSALVKHMLGDEDATTYVRKHYCDKSVESQAQVDFLHREFGIKRVEPHKFKVPAAVNPKGNSSISWSKSGTTTNAATAMTVRKPQNTTGMPAKAPGSIWGSTLRNN